MAFDRGLTPKVLDIGGGFRANYLAHEQDWLDYVSAIKEAVLGKRPSLTWHNTGFGLSVYNGQLRGAFNTYGFYEKRPGPAFLDDLLASPLSGHDGMTTAQVLSSNEIDLWIEPGRALLDQAGFTLARVNGVRRSSQGHHLILLDMKRSDISFLDQEIFVDPVLMHFRSCLPDDQPVAVFFAGNLCLESDLIQRHLTFLPMLPAEGDLLAFVNTAAYAADFSAGEAIMHPQARKVAMYKNPELRRAFRWALDEVFSPVGL